MITVVATGGFDPIHSGHIDYLQAARSYGMRLIVGINSDAWLQRKKGGCFMPFKERASIVEALSCVDEVLSFEDEDGTAISCLRKVKELYPNDKIIFVNGGDRTSDNIPETAIEGIEFAFGVGGDKKKNSSSWILKEWSQPPVQRKWGSYKILDTNTSWQVKELSFDPGHSLSDQRHAHRSEFWLVVEGSILLKLDRGMGKTESRIYRKGESVDIPKGVWHKATNVGTKLSKVIEVWLGDMLSEDDIQRRD